MLKYTVPFFVWANFDIEEKSVSQTSINYLSSYLLSAAGLELSPYHSFLSESEKIIPAINALGYYSLSDSEFKLAKKAAGEELTWLNNYSILQYNGMFDKKNQSKVFYEKIN